MIKASNTMNAIWYLVAQEAHAGKITSSFSRFLELPKGLPNTPQTYIHELLAHVKAHSERDFEVLSIPWSWSKRDRKTFHLKLLLRLRYALTPYVKVYSPHTIHRTERKSVTVSVPEMRQSHLGGNPSKMVIPRCILTY
ncbi:hypothetical protein LENED_000450 [Lentinula edodes]|uniref:Uncharacterized protein n=1 Tax=Lentinula edodes TaxID=5353 RepID=A0A1Q3DVK9_LENED|nr:hypothetical protein LENED_000450 [Lentinula edodes]